MPPNKNVKYLYLVNKKIKNLYDTLEKHTQHKMTKKHKKNDKTYINIKRNVRKKKMFLISISNENMFSTFCKVSSHVII